MDERIDNLEAELGRLKERFNKREILYICTIALCICGLLSSWATKSHAAETTISAERFVVKDSSGRTRAELAVHNSDDSVSLLLSSQDMARSTEIVADSIRTGVYLSEKTGNTPEASATASIAVNMWGYAGVSMYQKKAHAEARLTIDRFGKTLLALWGPSGFPTLLAGFAPGKDVGLAILKNGKVLWNALDRSTPDYKDPVIH